VTVTRDLERWNYLYHSIMSLSCNRWQQYILYHMY